jgi:formate hydrogenlyase transcriptional activator
VFVRSFEFYELMSVSQPEHLSPAARFPEITGCSPALLNVLEQVEIVAPTSATVLLAGETGTGKELVARAIHRLSASKSQPFVKVNCAAIPAGLLESELFGHERGAFTGAVSRKIGRFEAANQGTLFLDEIGDVPLELQPKLLRVLQEQQFERLGSNDTTRVNVRLIAATNRDLHQLIADRQFRRDLFYRLSVFPIRMPALRDRREDIPLLAHYFVKTFALRERKHTRFIPDAAMDAFLQWKWPGNVRELENFIERCVILSSGETLKVPMDELSESLGPSSSLNAHLEHIEKEHITRVLRETNGVVSGPRGAAARLGLKRTTLASRMNRLGIVARSSSD